MDRLIHRPWLIGLLIIAANLIPAWFSPMAPVHLFFVVIGVLFLTRKPSPKTSDQLMAGFGILLIGIGLVLSTEAIVEWVV